MGTYVVDREQLLRLIRYDCETFLGFYLGEDLDLAVPQFHKEIWGELLDVLDQVNDPEFVTGILKKLLAVPREHAKTTLVKLAVLLMFRYSKLSFVAYTSNTFAVAFNAIQDIKWWLTWEQDNELYGPTKSVRSSASDGLFVLEIRTPISDRPKQVIMKAFGWGSQIRGTIINNKRPDILVFDDIESKETAESPHQQQKLDSWCVGTAMKAMAKRGVCIFIGNMIADTSLLARLSTDPEWNPTVLGSIIRLPNGDIDALWPGRWTLDKLLADYTTYRRLGQGGTWEAEMMNLTSDEIFGESLKDCFRPVLPNPEQLEAGFICLDPAFGQQSWHDESAITVHVREKGADIPYVAESKTGRWTETQLFNEMLELSFYWGINTWAIEAQAAQKLLIPLFRSYLRLENLDPDSFALLPIQSGNVAKANRILAFRNAVVKGHYGISQAAESLVEKLEVYSPVSTAKDDEADSAAYGVIVWEAYGSNLPAGKGHVIPGQVGHASASSQFEGLLEAGVP